MPFLFYWGPLRYPIQYKQYCRAVQGFSRSTNGLKQRCSFDPNLFISRNSKEALVPQKDTMVPVQVKKLELFVERYSKTQQSQTLAWNIVKQKIISHLVNSESIQVMSWFILFLFFSVNFLFGPYWCWLYRLEMLSMRWIPAQYTASWGRLKQPREFPSSLPSKYCPGPMQHNFNV